MTNIVRGRQGDPYHHVCGVEPGKFSDLRRNEVWWWNDQNRTDNS